MKEKEDLEDLNGYRIHLKKPFQKPFLYHYSIIIVPETDAYTSTELG